jgi:hypothetical protein
MPASTALRRALALSVLLAAGLTVAPPVRAQSDGAPGGIDLARAHATDPRRITSSPRTIDEYSQRRADPRFTDRLGGRLVLDGDLRPDRAGASYRTAAGPTYAVGRGGTMTGGIVGPGVPAEGMLRPTLRILAVDGRAARPLRIGATGYRTIVRTPTSLYRGTWHLARAPGLFHYEPADRAPRPPDVLAEIRWRLPTADIPEVRTPFVERFAAAYARPPDPDPDGPLARLGELRYLPPPLPRLDPAVAPPEAGPAGTDVPRAGPDRRVPAPPAARPAEPAVPRTAPDRPAAPPPAAGPLPLPPAATPAGTTAPREGPDREAVAPRGDRP